MIFAAQTHHAAGSAKAAYVCVIHHQEQKFSRLLTWFNADEFYPETVCCHPPTPLGRVNGGSFTLVDGAMYVRLREVHLGDGRHSVAGRGRPTNLHEVSSVRPALLAQGFARPAVLNDMTFTIRESPPLWHPRRLAGVQIARLQPILQCHLALLG